MVKPLIAPGIAKVVVTATLNVCAEEVAQVLEAVTLMLPLLPPAVTLIVLVELVPVQPPGNVHEYDVAPLTVAAV